MKIRYRQIKKWLDIYFAPYYKYGIKSNVREVKRLCTKRVLNRLYGMQVSAKMLSQLRSPRG